MVRGVMTTDGRLSTRLQILRLLKKFGELSPIDIIKLDPKIPRGTIYTTLHRLESAEQIRPHFKPSEVYPGPRRPYYKITKKGEQHIALLVMVVKDLISE